MGLNSAKLFVKKMKEDTRFRDKVCHVKSKEAFWDLIHPEKFDFDERHLAGAMAACMTEMEESILGKETNDMNSDLSVRFENTNSVCPIGETTGKQMVKENKIPVISCEGSCIRGEIARLAANMLAKEEGYGRGCHGEFISVPQSAMATWANQSDKIVVIDGCFLHCHGRMMKGIYKEDQLVIIDALSYYKKYTDIMDIDDVPEAERKETATLVFDNVLKVMQNGGTPVCNENNSENSCCSCGQESTVSCCS